MRINKFIISPALQLLGLSLANLAKPQGEDTQTSFKIHNSAFKALSPGIPSSLINSPLPSLKGSSTQINSFLYPPLKLPFPKLTFPTSLQKSTEKSSVSRKSKQQTEAETTPLFTPQSSQINSSLYPPLKLPFPKLTFPISLQKSTEKSSVSRKSKQQTEAETTPLFTPQFSGTGNFATISSSWPFSFFQPNTCYAEGFKQRPKPQGISEKQNDLIEKIRKGRLDDPSKEFQRLKQLGLLSEKEEKYLNEMFPSPEEAIAKAIYAQALALKNVLGKTHYVFIHAQNSQWKLFSDVVKEIVKEKSPEKAARHYKFLRSPRFFAENLTQIEAYQTRFIDDSEKFVQKNILSSDGYFYNQQEGESAYSFFIRNKNETKNVVDYAAQAIKEFYPLIPISHIREIAHQTYKLYSDSERCGNLLVLCISKEINDAYYRSHSYGQACNCHPEAENRAILEKLQNGEMDESTRCNGSKMANPQYRLFMSKFKPEETLIYCLTPPERNFTKQWAKSIINELKQPQEILHKQLRLLWIESHFSEYRDFDPELLWKDKNFVLRAVKRDCLAFEFADPVLQKDKDIVLAAVTKGGLALEFVDSVFRKDKDIVLAAVTNNSLALEFADPVLRKDKEIVLAAITKNHWALEFADPDLLKDKDFMLAAVTKNGFALEFIDPVFQKDEDIVLAAVTQYGWALAFADPVFRKNKDIVLAGVTNNGMALEFADPALQKDKEGVLAAVTQNGRALAFADPALQKDKEVVLAAVTQNGMALASADPVFRKDKDFVFATITQNGMALGFADFALRRDKKVVLAAVTQNGMALEFADRALLWDKEVVLAAVKQNGMALEFAFRRDKEAVLAAVKQNGMALEFADPALQKDKEIVLAAVTQNGMALEFAHLDLLKDKDIILAEARFWANLNAAIPI